jgi:hypothetical protein
MPTLDWIGNRKRRGHRETMLLKYDTAQPIGLNFGTNTWVGVR